MIRWKRMAQENGGSGGNANETRRQNKRAELVGSETCGDVTWSGNGPIVVVVRMPTFQQYARRDSQSLHYSPLCPRDFGSPQASRARYGFLSGFRPSGIVALVPSFVPNSLLTAGLAP